MQPHVLVICSYIDNLESNQTPRFFTGEWGAISLGVLDLSLGREVPPGPWNPDPVYDKMSLKILKNWYPVYDFQFKFHSFFCQNAWFLDPVYKKSSEIFEFETLPQGRYVPVYFMYGSTPRSYIDIAYFDMHDQC